MDNRTFIKEFIEGKRVFGAYCHLGCTEDTLYNYSTAICKIDRKNKTAEFNCKKYSRTTSGIQNELRWQLQKAGYKITDYVGEPANMWNCGYQGAEHWKTSDFKKINEQEKRNKEIKRNLYC